MFIIFLIMILFFPLLASACVPCSKVLDFDETVKKSELIVIGRKVADGPNTASNDSRGGPDWIEVKVKEVLKGDVNQSIIKN